MTKSQIANRQQQAAEPVEYFNLHTKGCGYLSRVRWVRPENKGGRRSEDFLACAINALRGECASPAYTYFDVSVAGEKAVEIIDSLIPDVDAGKKVFVAFMLGDIRPHVYERNMQDRAGNKLAEKEWTALIKGRLLLITHVQVDGQTVYQLEESSGDGQDETGEEGSDEQQGSEEADSQPQDRTVVRSYDPTPGRDRDHSRSTSEQRGARSNRRETVAS